MIKSQKQKKPHKKGEDKENIEEEQLSLEGKKS